MTPNTDEVADFQNWLWGSIEPRQFAIRYPITYYKIGLLAGVSEDTVRHWMQNPQGDSYRPPSLTAKRLLALTTWWLESFEFTPQELIELFEQQV
ncbi:MAG: hypothetical protein WA865_11115 [Spirulinaceae cyanobacterium]